MTRHGRSAFEALARAHLRSAEERAVFGVIASGPARWWSVTEAARAAHVEQLDTDQALRRFAAAGIVAQGDQPNQYRYRDQMRYLTNECAFDATDARRDPVCGMPVTADAPYVAHEPGREVLFCSLPCLLRWQRAKRTRRRP